MAATTSAWHEGEQEMQGTLGLKEYLDKVGDRIMRKEMPQQHIDFFQSEGAKPLLFIGSVDDNGSVWASLMPPKPNLVDAPSNTELVFDSMPIKHDKLTKNLKVGAKLGLLGIEFSTRRRNKMNGRVTRLDDKKFNIEVDQSLGNCPKYIQARSWTYKDVPEGDIKVIEGTSLNEGQQALITKSDNLYIASSYDRKNTDRSSGTDINHRGGNKGFVTVRDSKTISFPDYIGNFFFNTLGNIMKNPKTGILFIDFEKGDLLQLSGSAVVDFDDKSMPGAQRTVVFTVEQVNHIIGAVPYDWKFLSISPYCPAITDIEGGVSGLSSLTITCKSVKQETKDVKTYTFADRHRVVVPRIAGQYATFELEVDGKTYIRTWTISMPQADVSTSSVSITVKRKEGGKISNWLFENMKEGMQIKLNGVGGSFTLGDAEAKKELPKKVLFIAGGVGITPFMAMIRESVQKQSNVDIALLNSNRTKEDIIYMDELLKYNEQNPNIKVINTITKKQSQTKWNGITGRIDAQMIKDNIPDFNSRIVYICGPEAFMDSIQKSLKTLKFPSANIILEEFNF